ncbi:hypothetical protein AC1031_005795 [Aphanomyces cochlioides]|nr:hypothetical protein AC1031_005795 [Aphanomyces cochlioides]
MKGALPEAIRGMVHEDLKLHPLETIKSCFVGEKHDVKPKMGLQDLHVLVIARDLYFPMKKLRKMVHEWKIEEPKIYSLKRSRLHFVDRREALQQLHGCHLRKFSRADCGDGGPWEIPLMDHGPGMGMTDFCTNYISKSREMWKIDEKTRFQQTLCDCHTVLLFFGKGELLGDNVDKIVLTELKFALSDMFVTTPNEVDYDAPIVPSHQFLNDFTERYGPLFIVFDELADAFTAANLDARQRYDKFNTFYKQVLEPWQSLKKVFFVVAGSGLTFVRRSFQQQLGICDYEYTRLKFNLFGRDEVMKIFDHTSLKDDEETTISDLLGLDKERFSLIIYSKRRTDYLVSLRGCNSLEKLLKSNTPDFLRSVDFTMVVADAAKNNIDVDMTEIVDDGRGKMVPLDQIAYSLCIDWEGTAENAKVYMDPMAKLYIMGWTLPLTKYLGPNVAIDCPKAFEWMCVVPQVQPTYPSHHYDEYSPYPDFATAEAEGFMKMIDKMGEVCLKPLPKSASLAALLACDVDMKLRDKQAKLWCGLVVKGYDGSPPFTSVHLKTECENFNRLFTGTSLKPFLRILIVGCTSYDEEIMSKVNGKAFYVDERMAEYPKIDEVIVLNLTSPERRAAFFQLSDFWLAFVENAVRPSQDDSSRLQ